MADLFLSFVVDLLQVDVVHLESLDGVLSPLHLHMDNKVDPDHSGQIQQHTEPVWLSCTVKRQKINIKVGLFTNCILWNIMATLNKQHFENVNFTFVFREKNVVMVANKHMWDLIFAPVCLLSCKSTDTSVSHISCVKDRWLINAGLQEIQ